MSSLRGSSQILAKAPVDLPRDVPLEAANYLPLAEAFLESSGGV